MYLVRTHVQGGAVSLEDSKVALDQLLFNNNTARQQGGGAFLLRNNATFTRLLFAANTAPSGAAVFASGSPAIDPQQLTFKPQADSTSVLDQAANDIVQSSPVPVNSTSSS